MTLPPNQLILLDTNIVVRLARADRTGQHIEATLGLMSRPEKPLISTVTEGELLGFARHRRWGDKLMAQLRVLLDEFVRVEAGLREIVDAYAELYADGLSQGSPCGENDLWIAATAKATNAVLLTSDRDFDWMHVKHITRHYVDPAV